MRGEGRAFRIELGCAHGIDAEVRIDHGVLESRGKQSALVDGEPAREGAAKETPMLDGVEVSEGKGIVQRAVLAEAFDVVAALHMMAQRFGGVAAGEELAVTIKVDAPRVAAPLREQLKVARDRMV